VRPRVGRTQPSNLRAARRTARRTFIPRAQKRHRRVLSRRVILAPDRRFCRCHKLVRPCALLLPLVGVGPPVLLGRPLLSPKGFALLGVLEMVVVLLRRLLRLQFIYNIFKYILMYIIFTTASGTY
jgi:hypothetical protein